MRLLASLVNDGDDSTIANVDDVGSMPRLDSTSKKLNTSKDSTPKEAIAKSTKSSKSKTTKASKDGDDEDASTTVVVTKYTVTQPPAPTTSLEVDEASDATLIRGRNLQLAGLTQAAVDAYALTFLQLLQSNAPAGTTVDTVVITSITEEADGSLSFAFDATSTVDCPAPCDQAQAQADSAAELEAVLNEAVSSGDFAAALSTNLVGVDCGTTFTCANLEESAANATVATDVSSLDACPSTKVIVCENGNATFIGGVAVNSSTTCQDACAGDCCVGGNATKFNFTDFNLYGRSTFYEAYSPACDGLTASICQDGFTCMDDDACKDANVGTIFLGCNGSGSCKDAGRNGTIGSITNSCFGSGTNFRFGACSRTATDGGVICQITNSCVGRDACKFAAEYGGFIEKIVGSCYGRQACETAAYQGNIAFGIVDSCNSENACFYAAGAAECAASYYGLSYAGGYIREIVRSCNGFRSCDGAAYDKGKIALGIVDSCNSNYSCFYAASNGNEIFKIEDACNSEYACYYAAYGGNITSPGIIGCCNTGNATAPSEGICYKATGATLNISDPTCSASVSVSVTADSDLINTDEDEDEKKVVDLGEFLTDLAHELFKIVKELTKIKKN